MRAKLPNRRESISVRMEFPLGWLISDRDLPPDNVAVAQVYFGLDAQHCVKEVFCLPLKSGIDLQTIMHHTCIGLSVGLQHGATMAELARAMGAWTRRPQSIPEMIVRQGAEIDAQLGAAALFAELGARRAATAIAVFARTLARERMAAE